MNDLDQTLETYFRWMNANGAVHVYRQAVQLGVLDALAEAPMTAELLAQRCGLQTRPTQLLLQALTAFGVTATDGDEYRLAPLAQRLLGGGYRNLGDEYWAHLPTLLTTGKPLVALDQADQSEAFYQKQVAALGWMLMPCACAAAPLLIGEDPRPLEILDVGAGAAIWSLLVASDLPGSRVTALDRAGVLPVAVQTAEQFGLADALQTLAGDYHTVELSPAAYDLVIVANVTHLETPAGNAALLARLRPALRPGGRLAIIDAFDADPRGALSYGLYALGLALRTQSGQVYSAETLSTQLTEAGYADVVFTPIDAPPHMLGLLTARV